MKVTHYLTDRIQKKTNNKLFSYKRKLNINLKESNVHDRINVQAGKCLKINKRTNYWTSECNKNVWSKEKIKGYPYSYDTPIPITLREEIFAGRNFCGI